MISVEEALAHVLALARQPGSETVPLTEASGRFLAAPVTARRDQPPFPASAMDGYAVSGEAAPGMSFTVVGTAQAGHAYEGNVGPGEAVRIFTGAPVPQGASRVVIQEDVTREGDRITLSQNLDQGFHIRAQGQDFQAGSTMEPRLLRPVDIALLAAMSVPSVPVTRRPVVAIIPTGDELVMPGEAMRDDQIVASNVFALKAMAEAEGAKVRLLPIARDTEEDLSAVLALADGADLIVTVGGASVGDHDLVGKVAADRGLDRSFYKIAMRPGKPLMAGHLGTSAMLGLPGNPVSAIVCGHLFMLPLIRRMTGQTEVAPRPLTAVLTAPLAKNGPRAHYMRAALTPCTPLPGIAAFEAQDSALLRLMSEADALLIRPVADPAREVGESVTYFPLW